jgi:2-succinyl-5-enolpyruvyl-6-hydroxy-3-cyclohexene-1-carboxylate synthase
MPSAACAWLPGGPRAIRPLASRGANGIDGVVSSALGAAATGATVALVIGDLALLHDLSGLVAARLHGLAATIVVVNNDGGGIFSFLPQATAARPDAGLPAHFEELFGTPHGIDLGPLVTALGAEHRAVAAGQLRAALGSLGAPGVGVMDRTAPECRPPPGGGGRCRGCLSTGSAARPEATR